MTFDKCFRFVAVGLAALIAFPAAAAPALRAEITIASAIVTVGDMFDNSGLKAEMALFRAPAPGTAGAVSIAAIRAAAARVGITEFDQMGISRVRVERTGIRVEEDTLKALIIDDLAARGILSGDVYAIPRLSEAFDPIYAEASGTPVQLDELRYTPGSESFSARFRIAGEISPREVRGRLDLMIEVPHLTNSLRAGEIVRSNDVEMRPVALRFAESSGFSTIDQIVGMQLRRSNRAGMMLRQTDITKPELVKRSEMVTIVYRSGPLSLSVSGQALNAAAQGEMVSVLNTSSKKVIHGIAIANGTVEMVSDDLRLADTQS